MANTTVPAELVAVNAIQGTLIADNAITSVHIATNAVSGTLVADNGITAVHIATNAVTPLQIQADAVTGAKIADDAIDSEHYADLSIDTAHIAAGQVTTAKLADNSVTSAKIVNGTIVAADLADDAVTIAKMAALARGKIIYGDASGAPAALALGSAGQILTTDGTDIQWGALSTGIDDNSNAIAMTIDSDEKIIIGDTASHTDDLLQIESPASGGGHGIQIRRNDANTDQGIGHILFGNNTATDLVKISAKTDGDSNSGDSGALMFSTQVTGGNLTERMRINSSGKVGINVTNPGHILEVSGDIEFSKAGDGNNPVMHVIDTADTEVAWFEGRRAGDTGAFISLWHRPSSAAGTNRSGIKFHAPDAGNNKTQYAMMMMEIDSNSEGSEDGQLGFHLIDDGSINEILTIKKDRLLYKGRSGSAFIRADNRADGHDTGFEIYQNGSRKWELYSDDSNTDAFEIRPNGASGKFTFTQDGELGIGYANPGAFHANYRNLVVGSGSGDEGMIIYSAADSAGAIAFARDAAGNTDSYDGYIEYNQSDRSMRFGTNAANERMRITGTGTVSIGTTSVDNTPDSSGNGFIYSGSAGWCAIATSQAAGLYINRTGDSGGDLVSFRSSGSEKGTISISGSTVSYNAFMGSHYTETTGDDPLLGTVMEFTGELVANKYASQKRLSKAKVSDTAESTKVYGVYLSDSSEDTGELIASLGASWCRIHKDETVAIGDLLVSKGDGTAKVQSDDIIRSKTIGKVTSTTKKEIYEDDSYIVPVVLYCG